MLTAFFADMIRLCFRSVVGLRLKLTKSLFNRQINNYENLKMQLPTLLSEGRVQHRERRTICGLPSLWYGHASFCTADHSNYTGENIQGEGKRRGEIHFDMLLYSFIANAFRWFFCWHLFDH